MSTTATDYPDAVDTFTAGGLTAVLKDERMAEPGEHPDPSALAYTVELYKEGSADPDADPLFSTTYTAGSRVNNPADAKAALWSLAGDAYAAHISDAPTETLDITDPEVRAAVEEFKSHYGYEDTAETLEAFASCVKTLAAFEKAGADASDLYERLDR